MHGAIVTLTELPTVNVNASQTGVVMIAPTTSAFVTLSAQLAMDPTIVSRLMQMPLIPKTATQAGTVLTASYTADSVMMLTV